MRIPRFAAGLLAGTLVLTGCAGTSTDGGGSSGGRLSAAPGFDPDAKTISVGVISPFSGPLATAGQGLLVGTQLYVDRINAQGGVAGKYKIKLVTGDSKYEPQRALSVYGGMADKVVMIGTVLGTGVTQAVLQPATADKMLLIPATDSSVWLRRPNTLPVRPTYEVAMISGLAYAVEQKGKDEKVCALLQDDPLGESIKSGVDHTVKAMGLNYAKEVRFPLTATDFTPQISQLKSAGCQIVAYGSTSGSAIPAMASAAQLGFAPQWVAIGPGFGENLLRSPVIDYLGQNWIVSSPGAEWGDSSVPGMAQLIEDYRKHAPKGTSPQPLMNLAGYTYGIAIVKLLEQAVKAGDLSHESLLRLSQSNLKLDFLGLTPDFQYGPVDKRQAPTGVTIFQVAPSVTGGLKAVRKGYDPAPARSFTVD